MIHCLACLDEFFLNMVITIYLALVTSGNPGREGCMVGGGLTKLLADIDTLLLLISCPNPGHKFSGNTLYAQFSSQNLITCPITNSDLTSMILNSSTSMLMNELLKSGYSVGRCGTERLTCVGRPQ
jgi:hypothetical protein